MSFLSPYFAETRQENSDAKTICVSAKQGSDFAKNIADDFNPIHDVDSKRFCVPGDLLFAIALQEYGVHESMEFGFQELVKADTSINYATHSDSRAVLNDRGKAILDIQLDGRSSNDENMLEQLVRKYVVFSGQNFPGILVPLMKQHQVMINPARPLVIYQSMSVSFDTLEFSQLRIELAETSLDVLGKRGNAQLHFSLHDKDRKIGKGLKKLVMSGLRPYEQSSIDQMCQQYLLSKESHYSKKASNV